MIGKLLLLAGTLLACLSAAAGGPPELAPPFPPGAFPIGVWLQPPRLADKYRELGINVFVGLWKGPTPAQLAALGAAGMPVICEQNDTGLTDPHGDWIVGWLQQDEPDNAQPLLGTFRAASVGWGSPVAPAEMMDRYRTWKQRDPSRPVFLGLGKGVAWDGWRGRGQRTGHPEDYAEYVKAGDIVSFDIYPAADADPAVAGRLQLVARGVTRLKAWAGPQRAAWATIGASRVNNPDAIVDPAAIRAQVWMALISGARGIIYFTHEFKPRHVEATWFANPGLAAAIRDINARVQGLADVILGPETADVASVRLEDDLHRPLPADSLAITSRRAGCISYVFAASLADRRMAAHIRLAGSGASASVLDEGRSLSLREGDLADVFDPYAVHLYAIPAPQAGCRGEAMRRGGS